MLLPRCNVAAMATLQPALFLNRTPDQLCAQVGGAYAIIARTLPTAYVDAMIQVRHAPMQTLYSKPEPAMHTRCLPLPTEVSRRVLSCMCWVSEQCRCCPEITAHEQPAPMAVQCMVRLLLVVFMVAHYRCCRLAGSA